MHYYNENDKRAAAWLRELIRFGHLPFGYVDTRSIIEVRAADLVGYVQCHFFAGISGWGLGLRLAGWPESRPCGSASLPCQPFSAAGKQRGAEDERHLWPVFFALVKECRRLGQAWTQTIFGEQVASAEVVGTQLEASFVDAVQAGDFAKANKLAKRLARSSSLHYDPRWITGVRADLESESYTLRAEVLGAHSVGAPHIRQRLFWVAYANRRQRDGLSSWQGSISNGAQAGRQQGDGELECSGSTDGLEHSTSDGREQRRPESSGRSSAGGCSIGGMGDADGPGPFSRRQASATNGHRSSTISDGSLGPWDNYELIPCADGKARRIESGTFPLAHGVPGRVGLLRGYGNAIVPQLAATFIQAFVEATDS